MDRHEKNSSLYDRLLKTATLYFKVSIESGAAKADLGSAMAMATQTQDGITSLGETLAPAPSDASGIFYAALKQSEAESMEEVYEAEVLEFGTLATSAMTAEASITSSGNLLIKFDSDKDITGIDDSVTVKVTYRR